MSIIQMILLGTVISWNHSLSANEKKHYGLKTSLDTTTERMSKEYMFHLKILQLEIFFEMNFEQASRKLVERTKWSRTWWVDSLPPPTVFRRHGICPGMDLTIRVLLHRNTSSNFG